MELIPIARTNFDTQNLIKILKSMTGGVILNTQSEDVNNNIVVLSILENLFRKEMLEHISYGFLCLSTKEFFFQLMQYQGIINLSLLQTVRSDFYLCLMSGDLQQYKDLVIYCSNSQQMEIREIANKLQAFFDSIGFRTLFSDYSKSRMDETTYRLVQHK